jgi:hypothetical protein
MLRDMNAMHHPFRPRTAIWLIGVLSLSLAVGTSNLKAQQQSAERGVIKQVDSDNGRITITAAGKDREFAVVGQTRFADASGKSIEAGLKLPGFKPGAAVMFRPQMRDGKPVLGALKLLDAKPGSGPPIENFGAWIRQTPDKVDMTQVKPITDMSPDERYKGFQGGLYPEGKNERPAGHTAAGMVLAGQIRPLDQQGQASTNGKIVLLTIGMSNTNQASSGFLRMAKQETDLNPRLVLVNGALGGMTASRIQNLDGNKTYENGQNIKYWPYVDEQLTKAEVTRAQVQAIWLKEADPGPMLPFPEHAKILQQEQVKVLHILHDRFSNLKLLYLSSRIYGGWAKVRLNPEPYAYESNYSVKWLVEQQLTGDADLNFDPGKGAVKAPWISWGPYLWANGSTPRQDGFFYVEDDLREDDRTHESEQGQDKVGRELIKFFKADPTSRGWFTSAK